jgi:putative transposase
MTFIPALRHDGVAAPFVLDGPINGEWFLACVKEALVPTLSPRGGA